jgi:hypothetical protein
LAKGEARQLEEEVAQRHLARRHRGAQRGPYRQQGAVQVCAQHQNYLLTLFCSLETFVRKLGFIRVIPRKESRDYRDSSGLGRCKFIGFRPSRNVVLTVSREIIMFRKPTTKLAAALGVALSAAAFSPSWAQDAGPKTREQVRAELLEAQRTGDIMADGETGKKLNEVFPNAYPAKASTAGLTREQVRAELIEAQRRGDVMVDGESGRKLNELSPQFTEQRPNQYLGGNRASTN